MKVWNTKAQSEACTAHSFFLSSAGALPFIKEERELQYNRHKSKPAGKVGQHNTAP
jgi:hypothetical protein